jgi:hypothetical protein
MSMSLTDEQLELVERFFVEELLPAAARAKETRGNLFPLGPNPDLGTYFQSRSQTPSQPQDFRIQGLGSREGLEAALLAMWSARGRPELASLAPQIAALADLLRASEGPDGDVSPFVYAMF